MVLCAVAVGALLAEITSSSPGVSTGHTASEPPPSLPEQGTRVARTPRPTDRRSSEVNAPTPPRASLDPLEIERELAEQDAQLAKTFAAQAEDREWASGARVAVNDVLDELAVQAPFRTVTVDCRETMCRAELQGTSTESAMSWGGLLVGANYGLGCSTRIRFAPGTSADTPDTATLFLMDCRRQN